MPYLDFGSSFIYDALLRLPGVVVAFTLHEYLKAFISTKLGDPIPKREGRVTLNPIAHFEILGFILFMAFGYGWGKPVNTTSLYYKNKRRDTLLTYGLPTVANFVLGIIFIFIFGFAAVALTNSNSELLTGNYSLLSVIYFIAECNVGLALINLIPIFPMDGAKVLTSFLNARNVVKLSQYEKILQICLVFFIIMGFAGRIFGSVAGFILSSVTGMIFG